VAFREVVLSWFPSVPPAPLWEQVRSWIVERSLAPAST
jgi:hypothetical protein